MNHRHIKNVTTYSCIFQSNCTLHYLCAHESACFNAPWHMLQPFLGPSEQHLDVRKLSVKSKTRLESGFS